MGPRGGRGAWGTGSYVVSKLRCISTLGASDSLPNARSALADALDASVARMQQAVDAGTVSAYYAENLRFHWLMVEAAGNAAVTETYRNIVQKLHLARLTTLAQDTGMRTSIHWHRDIAAAQRAGDAARCERLLADHVLDAHQRLAAGNDPSSSSNAS